MLTQVPVNLLLRIDRVFCVCRLCVKLHLVSVMSNETTALEQTAANLFLFKSFRKFWGPSLEWIELDVARLTFSFVFQFFGGMESWFLKCSLSRTSTFTLVPWFLHE